MGKFWGVKTGKEVKKVGGCVGRWVGANKNGKV